MNNLRKATNASNIYYIFFLRKKIVPQTTFGDTFINYCERDVSILKTPQVVQTAQSILAASEESTLMKSVKRSSFCISREENSKHLLK